MFKKFKDKLAEEVKSSPQRIHQFAQAAQAAVNSASSSISDITNNDLFSIGESDNKTHRNPNLLSEGQLDTTSPVLLQSPLTSPRLEAADDSYIDTSRSRKLSNSSFASDISFKLPSYDSPAMYHLQSDMDVSASEAEERGLASGISLDHVTKDQLYSAYRRTQDRYAKYRARYSDLARHYKVLERDNAKARSVLVETQDKALRRISELREQCSLEQSAKAHLESALRIELDEKNLKIESLTTKINLLHGNNDGNIPNVESNITDSDENVSQLIDLSSEENNQKDDTSQNEINVLNNRIEKMEQLLNKYKESVKTLKDRNSQLQTEFQVSNNNYEGKIKENEELKVVVDKLTLSLQELENLKESNEELQNMVNTNDFTKVKEIASLQNDLKQAQEEIAQLNCRIEVFNKREEEYAISLAENKLSIHKELESKEKEIKSLKSEWTAATKEGDSYKIMLQDYKQNLASVEEEKKKLLAEIIELKSVKNILPEMENEIKNLKLKCETQETYQAKLTEELKCLELQNKQEIAEKLAMLDRNNYLENRNKQLSDENIEKGKMITGLEKEMEKNHKAIANMKSKDEFVSEENKKLCDEVNAWKNKYCSLETEIQDERIELIKLQSEIEKLLRNHEMVQSDNFELHETVTKLTKDKKIFLIIKAELKKAFSNIQELNDDMKKLKTNSQTLTEESKSNFTKIKKALLSLDTEFTSIINDIKNSKNAASDEQLDLLSNNLLNLKNENNNLKIAMEETQVNYNKLEDKTKELEEEKLKLNLSINKNVNEEDEFKLIRMENETLKNQLNAVLTEIQTSKKSQKLLEEENKVLMDEAQDSLNTIMTENNLLKQQINTTLTEVQSYKDKYSDAEISNKMLKEEISTLNNKYDDIIIEKKNLNDLSAKVKEKCVDHENNIKQLKEEAKIKETILKELEEKLIYYQDIGNKYSDLVKSNVYIKNENEKLLEKSKQIKIENKELLDKLSKYLQNEKQGGNTIQNLQQDMKLIFDKNSILEGHIVKLTNDLEEISNNFCDTEKKCSELMDENKVLLQKCEHLKQEKETLHEKVLKSEQELLDYKTSINSKNNDNNASSELITNKELALNMSVVDKTNSSELNTEKNRLLSEIEGLQNHLQKVCKDNTFLNDQLREVLTNKDLNNHELDDINNLNIILQEEKQKVNDLLRENSVLAEKNLELEDCIKSHYSNLDSTNKNTEFTNIVIKDEKENSDLQEKYKGMVEMNVLLESKVAELELLSRSDDNSVQQLQVKNEKLKVSNEKLERRLDEALVSLRHFQALEESTELEYLRNILYEYLTGSGTHSETLAKVIAAVVKFDPRQTQMVLQREKERQGLLKQLGLL